MRIDKFLSNMGCGTRTQVKQLMQRGLVSVNGQVVKSPAQHIKEDQDQVILNGKLISYQPTVYLMLNKPSGVISATEDKHHPTVLDLVPESFRHYDLFPVGRLDIDTVGLLLMTNDGALAHDLLSPKKHVAKCYKVVMRDPLSESQRLRLEQGVDILDGYRTQPAIAQCDGEDHLVLYLTLTEGKFHQVKEMLKAVGNQVTFLERVTFGPLTLDPNLSRGQIRVLSPEEVALLKQGS